MTVRRGDRCMTGMSGLDSADSHAPVCKRTRSRTSVGVARGLHITALVLSTGMYACVVPPPLGLTPTDAGADATPVILSVHGTDGKELAQPGPVNVVAHAAGQATLLLYDADPADTLTVRVFVDYTEQNPTAQRSECFATPATDQSTERTTNCNLKGLCNDADVASGNPHWLIFEVYDREVIDDPLLFRSVKPGGQKSEKDYLLTCLAPS